MSETTTGPAITAEGKRQTELERLVRRLNYAIENSEGLAVTTSIPICFTTAMTEGKDPSHLVDLFNSYRAAGYDVTVHQSRDKRDSPISGHYYVRVSWGV